jgi:hypothetical protein
LYSVTDSYRRLGIEPKPTGLFDMPGVYHVGQPEYPEGNCYEHHIKMGETPCTPRIVCDLREEFRTSAARVKIDQDQPNHKEKEKDQPQSQSDCWDRELGTV